jgi:hypothetical protein
MILVTTAGKVGSGASRLLAKRGIGVVMSAENGRGRPRASEPGTGA